MLCSSAQQCFICRAPFGLPAFLLFTPAICRLLDRLAGRALRLLAFAFKSDLGADLADYDGSEKHRGHKRLADPSQYAAIESDLVFLGLAGLQDPPRPEVGIA